jgi:AraC-like DNA-binding protein
MIGGAKDMIAGCIDKMMKRGCGTCDRRDACESLMALFRRPAAAPAAPAPSAAPSNPFRYFLDQVAKAVEAGVKPKAGPIQQEVERHLEPLLAKGPLRMEQVARELGYSRQTLYRRLKAEGVTFEQLLDRVRRRAAIRMIREERLPVKDVAFRLGFSDPAAFSRAFKRWTGASPGAKGT